MGWYRVCLNTIVRKDVKLDSERLRILPMGSRVNVVKREGRRVMIDQPIKGWCSLSSSNGDTILKPLSDDATAQTPRQPEAQAAHYKQEATKAREQIKNAKEEKEIENLKNKAAQYEALSAQVLAQKEAHQKELASLSEAATSTDVKTMVFRDGDVIQLCQKNHDKGFVIVRTCIKVGDEEWIGVDYAPGVSPHRPAEGGTHQSTGNAVHFKPAEHFKGGWVKREEVVGYITGGSLLPKVDILVTQKQLAEDTLGGLQQIIKDLSKEGGKFPGLGDEIARRARNIMNQE